MAQVTTPNTNKFIFGSCKIEVGETEGTLVDLGAASGITFTESFENREIEIDNYGKLNLGIQNHAVEASGDIFEFDLSKINLARGGIDTVETSAGTPVADYVWAFAANTIVLDRAIKFPYQNYDGSKPSIDSVTNDPTGTPVVLAEGTDYVMTKDSNGDWYITFITGWSGNVALVTNVQYDYTPKASTTLSTGGKYSTTSRVVRFTHTKSSGKKVILTIFAAKASGGMDLQFEADDSGSATTWNFAMTGELDTTRTAGKQLFSIIVEE